MPKAWSGLSSTTPEDYDDLGEMAFCGPQFSAALTQTDEVIVVSDTLCHSLLCTPRGNLADGTSLKIYTGAGSTGTLLTCTKAAGALSSGQVRVRDGSGDLEFHADQTGATLYATYTYRTVNVGVWLIAQMWNAILRIQNYLGVSSDSYAAGENVVAGPGYVSNNLVYQADPSDITKCGWVWISAATTSGSSVAVYQTGKVTPSRTMPANTPIYCGNNGNVTWEGDSEAAALISTTEDYWHCIGVSFDGATLRLNTNQDARKQQ